MRLNFKRKMLRRYLKWRRFWEKFKNRWSVLPKDKPTTYQTKATQLWSLLLKDKESMLHYSNVTGIRQIHKKDVLVSFYPGQGDYYMAIIDLSGQRNNLYELTIRQADVAFLTDAFDAENDKRMRHLDTEKRAIIYEDLNFLLDKQEKALQKKKV
jgi:hypothetical protein